MLLVFLKIINNFKYSLIISFIHFANNKQPINNYIMYRKPSARLAFTHFVSTQSPNKVAQEIDHEAKTNVLSNTASAVEGPPSSKTIISGVPIKTSITPLHNMTIGSFEPIGAEKEEPDIREMSHRDLIKLERKGRRAQGSAPGIVEVEVEPDIAGAGLHLAGAPRDIYGGGLHLAGAPRMTGTGVAKRAMAMARAGASKMSGGGYGSLPNAFYGAILPVILDALNLPADKKTLQHILDIAAADFEKTKDKDRLIELVVEDYVRMIMGGQDGKGLRLAGRGMRLAGRGPVIRKYIRSALKKSMADLQRDGVLTGAGITQTFNKVVSAVKPYVKPLVETGKFLWKNREAIENVALKAAPFLML